MKAYQLKSGKWRAQAYLGKDANGESIRKSFTENTESAAVQKALECEEKYRNRVSRDALTVMMDNFIRDRAPVLSPSTLTDYRNRIRVLKQNYPTLCNKSVVQITSEDVQGVVNRMMKPHQYHKYTKTEKGASEKTIRNYLMLLSAIFKYAGLDLPKVKLPQRTRPEIYVPTEDEVKRLLDAARGTEMYIPVCLAAFGPLRRGEICALKYPEDFNGSVIHVHASISVSPDGRWVEKAPKTYASDRHIEMSDWIIDEIKRQGRVTELCPREITSRFEHLLKKAGLPHFRFHDLRHFAVSYLHAIGLPDQYVISRTGHGGTEILQRVYRHTLSDQAKIFSEKAKKSFDNFSG